MSTGARTEATSAAGAADGATGRAPDAAGRLLGRLSVLPALLVTAWLLVGLPLLLAGVFTPALMLVLSVPVAVALVVFGLRWVPGRWPGSEPSARPQQERTPWWAVAGVIAVAVAFGVDQLIYHSQFIIVTRDPASYIQFAAWIAGHGSLPIPQSRAAFGGTHGVLTFASPAFYQVGHVIVPQFMAGLPMVLAAGFWVGGVGAAVAVAPVLGACAVFAFGGLAARLAGPRWAPLAALVLAISLPEQYTSRSTFSEPLAQILFLGGLCLVTDSLASDGTAARVLAALGGLALGLTILVRIDGISDILLVVPFCAILLLGRRPQAVPLLGGLAAGAIYGGIDGLALSRPYLIHIGNMLNPLIAAVVIAVILTAVTVLVRWDRGLPGVRAAWLPAASAVPFVVVTLFAIRPYFFPGRIYPTRELGHLKIAWHHYFQLSLHWVFWYIGVPAVLLGALGAALLARRCLAGRAPTWTLPLLVFGWIIVTVLYRPAIVPHQPWASRRLVPGVLPGFILLSVWASGWLAGWLRQHGYDRVTRGSLVSVCVAALVLPAAVTTFGLGVRSGGPLGIRPVADGLAFKATESGEIAAVHRMCVAIPRDSSVVIIDAKVGGRLTEVVRGMCGDPVADIGRNQLGRMGQVVRGIEQAGRRPVILARTAAELAPYGSEMREIMALRTSQDEDSWAGPPRNTGQVETSVWMLEPAP